MDGQARRLAVNRSSGFEIMRSFVLRVLLACLSDCATSAAAIILGQLCVFLPSLLRLEFFIRLTYFKASYQRNLPYIFCEPNLRRNELANDISGRSRRSTRFPMS